MVFPGNVDLQKVKSEVMKIEGVIDFHHLHIWAISTTQNAMTGHLVVARDLSMSQIEKTETQHQT